MTPTHKLCTLDELLSRREAARSAGRTVVHCHGCFDIVHPGHIRHLQFARSLGDVLVVSVSADPHVGKGVNRPLIPDDLRAASVAALECVDWVYVNPHPTAVPLLDAMRPDVYVKGSEYEQSRDPRFLAERETVTRHGGRVVFSTCDVVYSSTALIGGLAGGAGRYEEQKLTRLRDRYGLTDGHLDELLQRAQGRRVVVVGDYVLDRYHFCDAGGVAGEAPMLSLRARHARDFDGGAGVIALHLAGLGARPVLVSALADDEPSRRAALRLAAGGVDVQCVRSRPQLVTKHRYLVDQAKLFKVDEGAATPSDSRQEAELERRLFDAADGADAVIFADFGYGVLTAGLLDRVLPALRERVPVLAGDASGRVGSLVRFREVDLLCPTEREAREAQRDSAGGLGAVMWNLLNTTGAGKAIVTLGKQGVVTFERSAKCAAERLHSEYVPALSSHAPDPLGCGDALLAAATLTLAAGGSLQAAALLGSIAAAIEVQEIGNVAVTAERVRAHLRRQTHAAAA
jgi:rfaE bifunctional protein kinase chain/domain/rfaE bifunctional protein nucleotidyltransferase chain/domain